MHCPSCGNESSIDQKFCRRCGLSLEPVSKLIAQDRSDQSLELDKAERERMVVRQMFRWITWGLIVIGAGVLMLVVNKGFDLGKWIGLAASLLLFAGTGLTAYGVISAVGKAGSEALKGGDADRKPEKISPTTKELADKGPPSPLPSVTERTTQLIAPRENDRHE